jgi:NADH-quinone oxidoreductase subunit N
MMAFAMLLFMFSMAGIPPLAGFWGKLYIFIAAVEAKLFIPAVLGVLASVVASYYTCAGVDGPVIGVNRVVAFVAAVLVAVFSLRHSRSGLVKSRRQGLFP